MCILPYNRVIYGDAKCHKRNLTEEHDCNYNQLLEQLLDNQQIRYYQEGSTGSFETMSYRTVGERFSFNYTPHLTFLHEKDFRNLWLNHIGSLDPDDNNPVSETNNHLFKDDQVLSEVGLKSMVYQGFIHPSLSIRHVGFVDGTDVGHGLFTEDFLANDCFLGEYIGIVTSNNENLESEELSYCCLYPSCDGGTVINAIEMGNMIRFINHSESPNAQFQRWSCDGVMHVLCITKRDISPDEQITVDYGQSYWIDKTTQNVTISS